jgi:probable phosphoglycerate mutase
MLALDPRLVEISHGDWEGRLAQEIQETWPDIRRAWRETPHLVRLPNGESFQDVEVRAWPCFREACQGLGAEDTALLVAHDAVCRVLVCRVLGLPLSRVWSFRQAATCLNLMEGPDGDHLQLVRLNDASHVNALFGETVHRKL